jgi:hypothetical protein
VNGLLYTAHFTYAHEYIVNTHRTDTMDVNKTLFVSASLHKFMQYVHAKQKIEEKRRLCRGWHRLRTPESNRLLNTATHELNSSISTTMIASKHSCKVLHQQNPLTIPCGRQPRNKTGQETFSTKWDITRNLGRKQCRKRTRFC